MKWTEGGISFEGTPAEYRELHSDGFQLQPQRTRKGKQVMLDIGDKDPISFPTVTEAAAWISQKTGRYVSAANLGKMLNEHGGVSLDRFVIKTATLFDNQTIGEENVE